MKRIRLWLIRILATLATIVGVFAFLILLAIGTEAGSRTSWSIALQMLNKQNLQIAGQLISGTLLDGLEFQGLQIEQTSQEGAVLELVIASARFQWQPWRLLDNEVLIDTLVLTGVGGVYQAAPDAPSEPLTGQQLQAMLFGLPVRLTLRQLVLSDLQFQLGDTEILTSKLESGLELDSHALQLSGLIWQQDQSELAAELSLRSSLDIQGNVRWQTVLADQSYQGELGVSGTLSSLELDHRLLSPLTLASVGRLSPGLLDGQALQFSVVNTGAELDLGPLGVNGFLLGNTELTTSGSPQDVHIAGTSVLMYGDLPETSAAVDLDWRDGQLFMNRVSLENAELQMQVAGSLQASPLGLQINWQLPRLSPGARFPQFRLSDVNGSGQFGLQQTGEQLVSTITIETLKGALNDRPLDVQGELSLVGASVSSLQLQAQSGDNYLAVQGEAGELLDLGWSIQAPSLVQVWEKIAGRIQGQGRITGSRSAPEIDGELDVENLLFKLADNSFSLESARVQARYQGEQNRISLELEKLVGSSSSGARELLQDAELVLEGSIDKHEVTASFVHSQASLAINLAGAFSEGIWSGILQQTRIESGYGDWAQQAPVNLRAGAEALALNDFCLARDQTTVCTSVSGNPAAALALAVSIDQLPLSWANRDAAGKPAELQMLQDAYAANLPAGLSVEGTVDVALQIDGLTGSRWERLSADLTPSDLVLQLAREQESELQTMPPVVQRFGVSDTAIGLSNQNQQWQSELGFTVTDTSETLSGLQGSFSSVLSLTDVGDIAGNLEFNFGDLVWLESVIPALQNSRGMLTGQAEIAGTSAHPLIAANINLQQASVQLPAYGLQLQELQASFNSTLDNTVTLQASALSGAGMINLDASVISPLLPERKLVAHIQGTDFTALSNEAATLNLSPDITLQFAGNSLQLSGQTQISKSHVDLAKWIGELSNGAVSESRDTVIVRNAEGRTTDSSSSLVLEVTLDMGLSIGQEVSLSGYGLDVMLGGALELEQEPGRPLLAYGELEIPTGTYEVYNQTLSARNGRLLFFGNPANPVLDIRAFRETDLAEVGLMLSGPVNRIQGELYSTPPLPENEILSLLVTGKSFNSVGAQDSDALLSTIANFGIEKGQGITGLVSDKLGLDAVSVSGGKTYKDSTLGLGKYITPNLLMHYEVGLFDRQFVLSLDYTLTEHLKLEVESGISQSVDISYTLEQD